MRGVKPMKTSFVREIRPAAALLFLLTVVCGVVYPLAIGVVARLAFPFQAAGSRVVVDGREVGSGLVGQHFDDPRLFWSRPSATSPPYDAAASSGSNLGPLNPALREALVARIAALRASDPENRAPIPVDLVTASASGLDPHLSPAGALWQVRRVARERGFSEERVRALVEQRIEGRWLGVLGEPVVDVVELNLALGSLR